MARPEKVAVVEEIREKLMDSDAAVLTEYRGLKVGELAELRGRPAARPAPSSRSSRTRWPAGRPRRRGSTDLVPMLLGPTAIAFVTGDAVIAAKALRDFARTNEALIVKGGLLGTACSTPRIVTALADVPPREVLLASWPAGFQAPLVKAAGLFRRSPATSPTASRRSSTSGSRAARALVVEPEAAPERRSRTRRRSRDRARRPPRPREAPAAEAPADAPAETPDSDTIRRSCTCC